MKEFDFTNAIKNPFAGMFKDGYRIIVHHNSSDGDWDEEKFYTPDEMDLEVKRIMGVYARENKEPIVAL